MTAVDNNMRMKFDSTPLSRTLSISELQRQLFNTLIGDSDSRVSEAKMRSEEREDIEREQKEKKDENKGLSLSMKIDEKSINAFAIKDSCVFSQRSEVRFVYHNNEMVFFVAPQINQKNETLMKYLNAYHQTLERHPGVMYERYGWQPDIAQRVKLDLAARLLGFVVSHNTVETIDNNDDNESKHETIEAITIKAQITLFQCNEQTNLSQKNSTQHEKKEIALVVFPRFQRQHLATDMVRITWNLFKFCDNEQWIYVMNSSKSAMFWRSLKQWYPDINFKLVRH